MRSCWLRKESARNAGKTKAPKQTAKAWMRLREVGPILVRVRVRARVRVGARARVRVRARARARV